VEDKCWGLRNRQIRLNGTVQVLAGLCGFIFPVFSKGGYRLRLPSIERGQKKGREGGDVKLFYIIE